jgi:hypothetical protein
VNGFSYEELREALTAIARHAEVVGFDLVEVNPMLDVASENTSLLAAQCIMEFLGRVVEHPAYKQRRRRGTARVPEGRHGSAGASRASGGVGAMSGPPSRKGRRRR